MSVDYGIVSDLSKLQGIQIKSVPFKWSEVEASVWRRHSGKGAQAHPKK